MPLPKPLADVQADLQDISVSDLAAALKSLQSLLPGTMGKKKDILLLQARLEKAGEDRRSGAFSTEHVDTTHNRIRYDFLDLVAALQVKDFDEIATRAATAVGAVPKFMLVYDVEEQNLAATLNKHLFLLKRSGKMKIYSVHADVQAGIPLEEAKKQLADTDYILCLVTLNLLTGEWLDFIWDSLNAGKRVIPIRISDIGLEDTGLEKYKSLPSQNRTLSAFRSEDAGYTDIVTEIRNLLPK